jgi:hypothetical protein
MSEGKPAVPIAVFGFTGTDVMMDDYKNLYHIDDALTIECLFSQFKEDETASHEFQQMWPQVVERLQLDEKWKTL